MSRKIVVLETSAAIQGLIKEKLGNKNVELSFEDKGLKLLVSVYNSIPSAILINASSQNPKASLLVRLIKSIEKLEKVPVGIYSTGEFVFEENFRNSCGADLFININDIEEKAETLLELNGKKLAVPLQSDLIRNGLAEAIFALVQNLNSYELFIQSFENLISKTCKIPAVALVIKESKGFKPYYICGKTISDKEENDFLKVCALEIEEAFKKNLPDGKCIILENKKLKNTDISDSFHSDEIPLSAYKTFFLNSKENKKIGSLHVIKEGAFSSAQLELLSFATEAFSLLMEKALLLKEKTEQEENIRKAFSRFVPEQIVDEFLSKAERGEKLGGGEKCEASVLYCDVRNFAKISEKNEAEAIVDFLNRYLTIMSKIIKKHGGIISNFTGTGIKALFGVPVKYKDSAERAVAAAYEMREALSLVSVEDLYFPEGTKFDIGIGIHYGEVIAGSIGFEEKVEYSAIGENVKFASALEELSNNYGVKILVSQEVRDNIKNDDFIFRLLDEVKFRERKSALSVYAVDRNVDEYSGIYRDSYKKGLALYKQGAFNLAMEYFTKASGEKPSDKASKLMLKRCNEFIKNPPENWNGAIAFTTK